MRTGPAGWRLGVAALLAAALAGCTSEHDEAARSTATRAVTPTTTPPVTTPTRPPLPDLPTSLDFHEVCQGTGFRDTAPFRGPGPHPIRFPDLDPDAGPQPDQLEFPEVPPTWKDDLNPRNVQLVACIVQHAGRRLKTCQYVAEDGSNRHWAVPYYWADYTIDVRAARTGRRIAPTVRVRAADTSCSTYDFEKADEQPSAMYSRLSAAQFQAAIGRWVTRRR